MFGPTRREATVADAVVPADRLDDEALELARTTAANGPIAVRLAKRS
jgi:enoyl-CoA hydratase/carnithine racemase